MATAAAGNERLGDILIREGLITKDQLSAALVEQKATGHRLGYVLVKLGLVQELEVTKVLAATTARTGPCATAVRACLASTIPAATKAPLARRRLDY